MNYPINKKYFPVDKKWSVTLWFRGEIVPGSIISSNQKNSTLIIKADTLHELKNEVKKYNGYQIMSVKCNDNIYTSSGKLRTLGMYKN